MSETPMRLRFDAFELDEGDARLVLDGAPVELPHKAFAVLCALARTPGRLITKDALLDAVWGHRHVSESVLKSTISQLRAALRDDAKQPRYIETASRRGYRFIGSIVEAGVQTGPPPQAAAGTTPAVLPDLPALARPVALQPLIGRQASLAKLDGIWARAAAGKRQVCWIAGEAGVGKTTLMDHFVARALPGHLAHGQCVEQHGTGEPYLPVLEALAGLCHRDPALVALMRDTAPTWLLQLPWLSSEAERAALRRELTGASQDRMLREMGELLDRYTREQPLLLVTEDLHWSDHATVHLMNHIARRRAPARLMWLASFRLAEVISEDHPLKTLRHELRLHRLCEEILLDPFSEHEMADYLGARVPGVALSESFVRALHARTDGLPLFASNVVDDLLAKGLLQRHAPAPLAEAQFAELAVPENLAGIMEQQIARLQPEQTDVLEAAAICGVEFRPATVAGVLERDAAWVDAVCEGLARQQHWLGAASVTRQPDGSLQAHYSFRHALYRHVFHERMGALRRAQRHRRAGLALQRQAAGGAAVSAAEMASHFELGHEPMAALGHYVKAAEGAMRHLAPFDAMRLTDRALALLPQCEPGSARDGLELALAALRGVASAQRVGVSAPDTLRAFERANALLQALPTHPMRSMVLHGLGLVHFTRGEYGPGRAVVEQGLALARSSQDPIMLVATCDLMGQINSLQGRPVQGLEYLRQGLAVADGISDEMLDAAYVVDPVVTMHAVLALPLLHVGELEQSQAHLRQAVVRAQRTRQPMATMLTIWFGALCALRKGDAQRVGELAAQLRTLVDEAGLAQGEAPCRWFQGWAQAHRGEPRAGYEAICAAHAHNLAIGMRAASAEVLGYAAEALVLAGDWAGASDTLAQAMAQAEALDERAYLPQMLLLRRRIALAQGDAAGAAEALRQALQEARRQQARWLEFLVLLAACEGPQPSPDDRAALADVLGRLNGGQQEPLVLRARALLEAGATP